MEYTNPFAPKEPVKPSFVTLPSGIRVKNLNPNWETLLDAMGFDQNPRNVSKGERRAKMLTDLMTYRLALDKIWPSDKGDPRAKDMVHRLVLRVLALDAHCRFAKAFLHGKGVICYSPADLGEAYDFIATKDIARFCQGVGAERMKLLLEARNTFLVYHRRQLAGATWIVEDPPVKAMVQALCHKMIWQRRKLARNKVEAQKLPTGARLFRWSRVTLDKNYAQGPLTSTEVELTNEIEKICKESTRDCKDLSTKRKRYQDDDDAAVMAAERIQKRLKTGGDSDWDKGVLTLRWLPFTGANVDITDPEQQRRRYMELSKMIRGAGRTTNGQAASPEQSSSAAQSESNTSTAHGQVEPVKNEGVADAELTAAAITLAKTTKETTGARLDGSGGEAAANAGDHAQPSNAPMSFFDPGHVQPWDSVHVSIYSGRV